MDQFEFEAIGSYFEVTLWDDVSPVDFLVWQREIIAMAQQFDRRYSRFITDSLVWQIADKTGRVAVDEEFVAMLKIYFDFYEVSDKKFTPLIGQAARDMGYDENYSLRPKGVIAPVPDLEKTVRITGPMEIEIAEPVLFDLGGVGKGYLVDKIGGFLKSKGLVRFMVNGSGDILHRGQDKTLAVGLEDPGDVTKIVGTLDLGKGALAASGSQKRNWGKYHHIIDPWSLSSPQGILASWVVAENATLADALATCLFLCPAEKFLLKYQFEWAVMDARRHVRKSAGFPAQFN